MNLEMLRQFQHNNADELAQRGHSNRTCRRFTKAETAWLKLNATRYTAVQAGEHLGHKTNTIRARAERLGVTLKAVKD